MIKFQNSILVFLLLTVSIVSAQDFKFGKISKAELEEKVYAQDSSASAAVLYRKIKVSYNYVQSSGFQVITQVHERVKIYTNDGFEYATIAERLYKNGSRNESFSGLKAYTYNLENHEVVKSKLKNSDTFSKELSQYYDEKKFTMPNVKEGSVIEYEYKLISPFDYSIDEVVLQYDIPIKKQNVSVNIPDYYSFKTNMKGYLYVVPKKTSTTKSVTLTSKQSATVGGLRANKTSYSTNNVDYKVNITNYDMTHVPALKDEPYVNSMENYRSSVNYEVQYVKFPNSEGKDYATTWEDVVKTIFKSDNFGKQLDFTRYYKDDLASILTENNTDIGKVAAIFSFVQKKMNWNSYIGKYVQEGVKDAYKKESGSVADINLMLVSMLKKAGLNADPVLISTRDNGVPLFPTRKGFNYVLASVELDGKNMLLDASNKFTEPNLVPIKALNWSGRVINEDGSSTVVPLVPSKLSKKISVLNVALKANGEIQGKERKTHTFYEAYLFRNNDISEDDYLEKKEKENNGIEISNYQIKNKEVLGKPIMETYDFVMENQADIIGDKLYFSPLFFHAETKNSFKLEDREYPIDFAFPRQEKVNINIEIPSGYEITSMPEEMNLSLPNGMGSFKYRILNTGTTIQIIADVKINQAVIPAQDYAGIKEFYKNIVEKQTEKVVLSKI